MRRRAAVAIACALSLSAGGAAVSCSDEQKKTESTITLPPRDASTTDAPALPPGTDIPVPPTPKPDCDPQKPFGAPILLPGFDSNAAYATPRLAPDELTIYFTAREPDGGPAELARAERASRSVPFGPLIFMTAQNSIGANDNDPSVALDHLSLWFHSARSGNAELYFATRNSVAEPFGPPAIVPTVNQATTPEAHAYYRAANGGELWFVSLRGTTGYDVYIAKRQGQGFANPVLVPELSSDVEDWQPAPSEDGLRVLLATNRDGGVGGFDLWIAERSNVASPFGAPKPIPEINSAVNDFAGWISPDGCRVYFSSARDTADAHHRLWYAERPK